MQGIPDVKDTDAEDVVWGLQTAASLWKRGERIDALVWLRRAAQAAGDANDDDRALELARLAAELTEWMANAPNTTVVPTASSQVPPAPAVDVPAPSSSSVDVVMEPPSDPFPATPAFPPPAPRPQPPLSRPPSQPTMQTAEPAFDQERTPMPGDAPSSDPNPGDRRSASVPPAEKVHAGMFNPWEDGAGPPAPPSSAPSPSPPVAPRAPSVAPKKASVQPPQPPRKFEEEEVVTSVGQGISEKLRAKSIPSTAPAAPAAPPPTPGKPPPLPPRALAKPPVPKPSAPSAPSPPRPAAPSAPSAPSAPRAVPPSATKIQAAPPVPPPDERPAQDELDEAPTPHEPPPPAERSAPMTPVPPSPTQQIVAEEQERLRNASIPPPEDRPPPSTDEAELPGPAMPDFSAPPPPPIPALDLESVDAFSDLPDDAREAFAAAATVSRLGEGEEVSHFALAYIVTGEFDVSATMVDAPAVRLRTGAVQRSRGTTDEAVPMRLVSAAEGGVVATWSAEAVDEAFRSIPWVEDDLRAAADRVLTLVGITIGPLGERLDVSIREEIVGKLQMRPLLAGEVIVKKGEPVPGLLLVGVGELELVDADDKVTGTVSSGDFLFAGEVLHAGEAPSTARAGAGGALVLFGDRRIAQELLVTCPPLLEVFAGM